MPELKISSINTWLHTDAQLAGDKDWLYFYGKLSAFNSLHVFIFRYLSQGVSFRALTDEFQIGTSTVMKIVDEVSIAICHRLGSEQLPLPKRQQWF